MGTEPAERPGIFEGIPDEDPGDEEARAPVDGLAIDRKRRRRVVFLVVLMLLGIILILMTPLFSLL